MRVPKGREPYVQDNVPAWESPIRDAQGQWITSHVINQDIVAWAGQGRITDRTKENLRSSDLGITMMRQRFFEEIEAVQAGRDPKGVIRDREYRALDRAAGHDARDQCRRDCAGGIPELPDPETATEGIPPPLRPAGRGAARVRTGDGDRG